MDPLLPISIAINLSIKEVSLESFNWSPFGLENKDIIPADQFEFNFVLEMAVFEDESTIRFALNTTLLDKRNIERKNEICRLKSVCNFIVADFKTVIPKKDNQLLIPDQLIELCAGISLANARGMFVIKLESSLYSKVFVPLVDTKMFIPRRQIHSIG